MGSPFIFIYRLAACLLPKKIDKYALFEGHFLEKIKRCDNRANKKCDPTLCSFSILHMKMIDEPY